MNGQRYLARVLVVLLLAQASAAQADVVTSWNGLMVATVSGQNPFAQARIAAIMHLAVFEAVNGITRDYRPYASPPLLADPNASAEAAGIAAAHRVLVTYVPASAAALDAVRVTSLALIPDGAAKDRGVAVGEAAAARLIAQRATDGSAPPAFHLPPHADAGEWQLTPSCPPAGGILAHWKNVTPFAVDSAARFRSAPPPPLPSRRYARDFDEVKHVGAADNAARTPHLADVVRFYAVVLAVGTWNPVTAQVSVAQGHSLTFNARLFALLNVAISDALVAVMDTKYEYTFWRPETAIRHADIDGNSRTEADPAWTPFIAAPCFPSYGSAHAAASAAARTVAEALLGDPTDPVSLMNPAVPGVLLEYDAFDEITDDIDDARVYGGIHFRFDQRAGTRQGRQVARWILAHTLRPAPRSEP
jgi:hypothetical protein